MITFKAQMVFLFLLLEIHTILQWRINFLAESVVITNPGYYSCANSFPATAVAHGYITSDHGDEMKPLYFLNETAEELEGKGYQITVHDVKRGDVLTNFSFTNGKENGHLEFKDIIQKEFIAGGENSSVVRSFYMAQIGERRGELITWLCDGVLINKRWILSAAHCFSVANVNPNFVRLGDYNLSATNDPIFTDEKEFIRDYPIHKLVPYPDFNLNERYHDLILIQIPREIPINAYNFVPICLPWDSETNKNYVGSDVTLSGWGATKYGGSKTNILQKVTLKVFNTSVCNEAYANIPDIQIRYPTGITEDKMLCIGLNEDGKDSCGGDSGAPIVYNAWGRFTLAGIVSGGIGCLKLYPGLYIPVNKPRYLQWIKDVAFSQTN